MGVVTYSSVIFSSPPSCRDYWLPNLPETHVNVPQCSESSSLSFFCNSPSFHSSEIVGSSLYSLPVLVMSLTLSLSCSLRWSCSRAVESPGADTHWAQCQHTEMCPAIEDAREQRWVFKSPRAAVMTQIQFLFLISWSSFTPRLSAVCSWVHRLKKNK